MRLPSRFAITALRQTFSAGILKAYIDSSDTIGEKDSKCSGLREPHSDNLVYQAGSGPRTANLEIRNGTGWGINPVPGWSGVLLSSLSQGELSPISGHSQW